MKTQKTNRPMSFILELVENHPFICGTIFYLAIFLAIEHWGAMGRILGTLTTIAMFALIALSAKNKTSAENLSNFAYALVITVACAVKHLCGEDSNIGEIVGMIGDWATIGLVYTQIKWKALFKNS